MTDQMQTYEGMFLMDAGQPDFEAASAPVRNILTRYVGEMLAFKLWDERRLAYEIKGRKRGMYILAYFKADPQMIVEIERDCRLDERILRSMLLRRETLTEAEINAEPPITSGRREDRYDDERGFGQDDDDDRRRPPRRRRDEVEAPSDDETGVSTDEDSED